MKLTVRPSKFFNSEHPTYLLCNEQGEPLPRQSKLTIQSSTNDITRLTVEFIVDDDDIKVIEK